MVRTFSLSIFNADIIREAGKTQPLEAHSRVCITHIIQSLRYALSSIHKFAFDFKTSARLIKTDNKSNNHLDTQQI